MSSKFPKAHKPLVAEKRDFKTIDKEKSHKKKHGRKPIKKKSLLKRIIIFPFRVMWWIISRFSIAGFAFLALWVLWDLSKLPDDPRELMDKREKGSITLLDQNSEVFTWRGDQFGGLISTKTASKHLINAVVATEDKRFFRHIGISPRGMMGAMRINIREGRGPFEGHGGSTITQQVAKRVFFEDISTLTRKIYEIPRSLAMEIKYTKNDILNMYLNLAYLGAGTFGFEAAAQGYFNKTTEQLNAQEAAMLAGLLVAPSRFAPTRNLKRAQERADLVLRLMAAQKYLTIDELELARANPATLNLPKAQKNGGYFADWIIETAPKFLIDSTREDLILKTTFDPKIQNIAEAAVTSVFETKVSRRSDAQTAVVVMSADGAVRAMLGGRETQEFAGYFNRATQALRQTGSAFKPFVYAAALEQGLSANTIFEDAPVTIQIPRQADYSPQNYSKSYLGPVTLTDALALSLNTVAVQVSEGVGRERVRALAKDFGIRQEIVHGPSLALGASESSLLDMTGAYAGILNSGLARRPYGLEKISLQDDIEPLFEGGESAAKRVISDRAAGELTYMMHQVIERGTGKRAQIAGWELAGKTGTTQGARDAWFIGFNADYVVGIWMGYDDNRPLNEVTGGGLPAEIWREIMLGIVKNQTPKPLNIIVPRDNSQDNLNLTIEDAIRNDIESQDRTESFLQRLFNRLSDN